MSNSDLAIDMGDGGWVFTDDMAYRSQMASIAGAGFSLLLALFICSASIWIYRVPSARHHLNRVSFRLLLWSMFIEIIYDSFYIYLYVDPLPPTNNSTSCTLSVYFMVATMGTGNWLCTFIGVNLMLAICFGINPIRSHLERWYVGLSIFLGFGIEIVPAALGHFGLDNAYEACYFTEMDKDRRIRDFVVDLDLWQLLSCAVAAGSVLATLVTLVKQSRATKRALFQANSLSITEEELSEITSTEYSSNCIDSHCWSTRMFHSVFQKGKNRSKMNRLEDKFIHIALKISLYPLMLCIINAMITTEDLLFTGLSSVNNQGEYIVYTIYYFLYGGRGLFFALLGIFVDPCLRRGLPAAFDATFRKERIRRRSLNSRYGNGPDDDDDENKDTPESIADFLASSELRIGDAMSLASKVQTSPYATKGQKSNVLPAVHHSSAEIDEKQESISREELLLASISYPQAPTLLVQLPATPIATTNTTIVPTVTGPKPDSPRSIRGLPLLHPFHVIPTIPFDPSNGVGMRRTSDPAIGASYRRKKAIQEAAEKMFADAEAQL